MVIGLPHQRPLHATKKAPGPDPNNSLGLNIALKFDSMPHFLHFYSYIDTVRDTLLINLLSNNAAGVHLTSTESDIIFT